MADLSRGERDFMKRQEARRRARLRRLKRKRAMLVSAMALILLLLIWGIVSVIRAVFFKEPVDPASIVTPDWIDVQLLDPNPYSRPGTPLEKINGIVVHYTANPGTTAQQNRNYFNNLAKQNGESATSVSSHFIIGLDGEIIQCIPLSEISYEMCIRDRLWLCTPPSDTSPYKCRAESFSLQFFTASRNAGFSKKSPS